MKNVQNIAADWAVILKKVMAAFFDVQDADSRSKIGKKATLTASNRVLYSMIDWAMTAVETGGIMWLYAHGFGAVLTAAIAWLFELVCAVFFLVLWYKFGLDLPLGTNSRRAVDQLKKERRILGMFFTSAKVFYSFFWEGPESILIFYNKEIGTGLKMSLALLILTASHSIVWTVGSIVGFEIAIGLW